MSRNARIGTSPIVLVMPDESREAYSRRIFKRSPDDGMMPHSLYDEPWIKQQVSPAGSSLQRSEWFGSGLGASTDFSYCGDVSGLKVP
jgi:hypothetical protein